MLTKTTTIDRIEFVPEANVIQVREVTKIMEDEQEISSSYHRYCIDKNTDKSTITDENLLKAFNAYFA